MSSTFLTPSAESVLSHTFARAMARAGWAIGEMSGTQMEVTGADVRRCSPAEVIDLAGGPEAVVVGVYVGIAGSLSGHGLLMLSPASARRLAAMLLDGFVEPGSELASSGGELAFSHLEISALQEVGNVTISAFLNEVGRHLEEPAVPTVPQAIVEMAGAILDGVLMDLAAETNEILAARTTFREGGVETEGALLVLPRPESLRVLLDALGASDE
jgi:chemotaxis protein CheC